MKTTDTDCRIEHQRGLERPRYYAGQLVTADDLNQEQVYLRERLRRSNRMLWGWGIVCGLSVSRRGSCEVAVTPGYALGPYGDEIVVDTEVIFDVCEGRGKDNQGCDDASFDPWCGDVPRDCTAGRYFLCIRHAECKTRPVRSPSAGCSESDTCEFSRIRDSFELRLLDEEPESSRRMPPPVPEIVAPCVGTCPPCPSDPWVVLAVLELTSRCTIRAVSSTKRRYVASLAHTWRTCSTMSPGYGVAPDPMIIATAGVAHATRAMTLHDTTPGASESVPLTMVSLIRSDGSPVMLPGNFTVVDDDSGQPMTVSKLLDRQGKREYYDSVTDDYFTLAELYAMAGVPPTTEVSGTSQALGLLAGRRFDINGYRVGKAALELHLDAGGRAALDRDFGGSPARARELPATALPVLKPTSKLGKSVGKMPIGEIADMPRTEFIEKAVAGLPAKDLPAREEQAGEVWDHAYRLVGLTGTRRRREP